MADKPGVTEKETSSAATHYYDAPLNWIKKQGTGVAKWAGQVSIDPGKFFSDISAQIANLWSAVNGLRQTFTPGGIINLLGGILDKIKGKAGQAAEGFLKPLFIVKNKIVGAINTAEGKAIALFTAGATLLVGGGVLLGAGPETITGMLKAAQYLYQFNWTESDEDIEKQIQGSITNLYGNAGSALGTGLASFVTGGVFKLPRVQINMTKISILWRALNEEAREEMMAQLRNLARTTFFTGLNAMLKYIYRSFRKYFKIWAKQNPNHPLIGLVPGGIKTIEAWGAGGKPWRLSQIVMPRIENLQNNPVTQNIGQFLQNFVDDFSDGISDFLPEIVRSPIV